MTETRKPDPRPRPGSNDGQSTTSPIAHPRPSRQRLAVIGALQSCHGEVEDKSGRATAVLTSKLPTEPNSKAMAALLSAMDRDGVIEREVRGKRTFKIKLVGYDGSVEEHEGKDGEEEEEDNDNDNDNDPASASSDPPSNINNIHVLPTQDEPVMVGDPGAFQPTDYDRLAHALLTQVGSILANGGATYDALLTRLHDLGQERARLVKRAEIAEALAHGREMELEGLRRRLAIAESNIDKMMKQSKGGSNGTVLDGQAQRAIEKFMQERPHERQG